MKRTIAACALLFLGFSLFAQADLETDGTEISVETSTATAADTPVVSENETDVRAEYVKKDKIWPNAKRPQAATQEQISSSNEKNLEKAGEEYEEETRDVLSYGLTDEICDLLDELTSAEDYRFKE